ncbi:hypothetical protein ES703_55165 [subsurface metagenome]
MQNQKSKLKTDLKQRAYKYSIKIIGMKVFTGLGC